MADFIHIDVKVDSVTTWRIPFNKHKTTADLYRAIRERDKTKGTNFEIILNGDSIPESNTSSLDSAGFKNNCTVNLGFVLSGGGSSESKPEEAPAPAPVPVPIDPVIPRCVGPTTVRWTTTEPCRITDDDDPEVKRAKMPCGCVLGTEALRKYCEEKVDKGWFRFPCAGCNKIWHNKAVSEALSASIPDSEFESFSRKVNQNYFSGSAAFKTCPFCGAYVRRDPSKQFLNVNWVECPVCSKEKGSSVTFCWNCNKAWIGSRESCGNSGCEDKDPRIKILEDCDSAEIDYISVTGVPKFRACVDCGRIIQHKEGCKHMKCVCGCEFCFVCLKKKLKVGGSMDWQCGSHETPCTVAPRQKVILEFQPMTKA